MSSESHKPSVASVDQASAPAVETEPLWDAERAAAYLGFQPSTLVRKARTKEVPYFDVFGERRWSRRLLDEWLHRERLMARSR